MGCFGSKCVSPYSSLYEITVESIEGTKNLEEYRGKVLLIVNVASECAISTSNYKQLVQINTHFASKGLQILAFPCNQFNKREPGTNQEILKYVKSLGVEFPVFDKVDVNGDEACELYKFLRAKSNLSGGKVGWNFGKFVVNRDASIVEYYPPNYLPLDICEKYIKYF